MERINVNHGTNVCIGDPIVVLTAMKMEVSNIMCHKMNYILIYKNDFSM